MYYKAILLTNLGMVDLLDPGSKVKNIDGLTVLINW